MLMPKTFAAANKDIHECYICGRLLDSRITLDHIIPNEFFDKNHPFRPKLKVHHACNNLKSKDDEWFVKQIQLRCSFNPVAHQELTKLLDKAQREKPDAYIVGKKLHNYKLAMGIFKNMIWGMELRHKGQGLIQMQISKEDSSRFKRYFETMCKGLFIRNVPGSKPSAPELIQSQYPYSELKRTDVSFTDAVKNLLEQTRGSHFGQQWGKKILYVGSRVKETPNKGFIFIQFYIFSP